MRIPQRLLIAGTIMGLAGCATAPQPPQAEEQQTAPATESVAAENVPDVEMDAELLYQLLVAEFAAQEGQMRLSADAYLKSAEETRDPRLARRATQAAVYARDAVAALTAADLWVELEPDSIDARQSLAALLIRNGQLEQAVPHLKKIIAFSPEGKRDHGFQLVANLLANTDRPEQSLELMAQLTADYPGNPDALYAHAQLAHEVGEYEKARALLQKLLKQEPKHSDALVLQARVLHELGEEQKALESLHQALRQNPDNDRMRMTYARMLVDEGQLKAARKEFRILHRHLPQNSDVIYALGLLALEAGDIDDAEPFLLDLVRLGEHEEEVRFALGQIAQVRNQPQEAIDWFMSVPPGERYLEAQAIAASIMTDEKGLEPAVAYLKQLPLNTKNDRIHRSMAIADLYAEKNHFDKAMATYDEALANYPDNAQILYARAITAEQFGRIDILEQDLRQILKSDPNNAQALNALGYTLADQTKRYEEAYDYIQKAYALQPDDPAILDSMGWGLYRLGRYDEALDYLHRAADKMPRDPEVAAHLGEVLWVSGDKAQARRVWNAALEHTPDHKVLKETLKRFNP
jgi:tetratricopeptide (TPR) repeat protein